MVCLPEGTALRGLQRRGSRVVPCVVARGRRAIHSPERLARVDLCASTKKGARGGNMVSPAMNQLLRIEEELGDKAVYPGFAAFKAR